MAARNEKPSLRYALAACHLGRLLLAGTAKGVCAVFLGDDDTSLLAELKETYPGEELVRADGDLRPWVKAVQAYLQGETQNADVPLDVAGTKFQWRVWRELMDIPLGHTRSYGAIAKCLGKPKASRAVGRACATNPVSLLIPCHRAVREDGSLGGYRWGVKRKQKLLDWERKAATLEVV